MRRFSQIIVVEVIREFLGNSRKLIKISKQTFVLEKKNVKYEL